MPQSLKNGGERQIDELELNVWTDCDCDDLSAVLFLTAEEVEEAREAGAIEIEVAVE